MDVVQYFSFLLLFYIKLPLFKSPCSLFQLKVEWKYKLLSHVRPFVTPWSVAQQAPLFMEFSRQEY